MEKNELGKHFLKQLCVFDVTYAIQDELLLSRRHQTNFKAGWWDQKDNKVLSYHNKINILWRHTVETKQNIVQI